MRVLLCAQGEEGSRVKWWNPRTWFPHRNDSEADFKAYQSEGLRGGVSSGVLSFARKLLGGGKEEVGGQAGGLHQLPDEGMKGMEGEEGGMGEVGGKTGINKGGNERFVGAAGMGTDDLDDDINGRVSDDGEVAAPVQFRPHEAAATQQGSASQLPLQPQRSGSLQPQRSASQQQLTPRNRLPPLAHASPRTVAGPMPPGTAVAPRPSAPQVPPIDLKELPPAAGSKGDEQLMLSSARDYEPAAAGAGGGPDAPPPPPVPTVLTSASRATTPVPGGGALRRFVASPSGRSPSPAPAAAGLGSPVGGSAATGDLPGAVILAERPITPQPPSRTATPPPTSPPADGGGGPVPPVSVSSPPKHPVITIDHAPRPLTPQPPPSHPAAAAAAESKSSTPPSVPRLRGIPGILNADATAAVGMDASALDSGPRGVKVPVKEGQGQGQGAKDKGKREGHTMVEMFSGASTERSMASVKGAGDSVTNADRVHHPKKWA